LIHWLGEPALRFDPCDYGDAWRKKTLLWGNFTPPERNPVPVNGPSPVHYASSPYSRGVLTLTGGVPVDRQTARSMTPQGFAHAFAAANR
jgi:hypothetical protein